jgi:hypothetical protein
LQKFVQYFTTVFYVALIFTSTGSIWTSGGEDHSL